MPGRKRHIGAGTPEAEMTANMDKERNPLDGEDSVPDTPFHRNPQLLGEKVPEPALRTGPLTLLDKRLHELNETYLRSLNAMLDSHRMRRYDDGGEIRWPISYRDI